MDMRLKGKTAVVTGAGRGIGLSTVRALNAEGVRVLGAARTITAELKNSADVCYSVDLTTPHGPSGLIDRAMIEFDGIDLLVNNAGGGDDVQLGGSSDLDDKHWYDTFALNLFAAVRELGSRRDRRWPTTSPRPRSRHSGKQWRPRSVRTE